LNAYASSEFRSSALYEVANAYYTLGDYPTAAQEYRQFIQGFPDDSNMPQALLNYGECLLRLEDANGANKIFNRILQQYPNSPQAAQAGMLVGETFVIQQQCDKAEQVYAPVISGGDRILAAQAQMSLARCYERTADLEKAVTEYLKMIYLYSEQKDFVDQATYAAATIYEQLGRIPEARNLYQKLVNTAVTPEIIEQAKNRLRRLQ
jgi:tetratricopeptide (TPR) repeat protein